MEAANTNVGVDNCPAGATIGQATDIILLPTNTYTLTIPGASEDNNQTGDLDIAEAVTLVGQGRDLTTITTNLNDRLIEASSGTTLGVVLTIRDLTLTNGNAPTDGGGINIPIGALLVQNAEIRANTISSQRGGGIHMSRGALYLINTLVAENSASDEGGGMYSQHGTVNLNATRVMSNSAGTNGAGLATLVGSVLIESSDFISNTALDGGGAVGTTFGLVVLRNTTLADNYADQRGGGVYSELGGIVVDNSVITGNIAFDDDGGGLNANFGGIVMHDSIVSNNFAGRFGGGIYQFAGLGVYINSEMSINEADNEGGGLYYYYGMGYMRHMLFEGNLAEHGGGLYTGEAATDIRHAVFRNNTATGEGGGIDYYFYGGHILADSVIEGNTAEEGGGFFTDDEPTIFLERVTIANNTANDGGGIHGELNGTSLIELLNVTLSGNEALARGGAIYTQNPLFINYSTLVDNGAVTSGGGVYLDSNAPVVIQNSIVGDNRVNGDNNAVTANCDYGNSAPASNGHNVFSDGGCNPMADDTIVSADDIIGLVVGALANNGGPTLPGGATLDTHALVTLSVAIDAGESLLCPATDARGIARPMNLLCDMGAYEGEVFELTVALGGNGSGSVSGDGINCGGDCTESYFENRVVNLVPSADAGSTFSGWSGDCGGTGACVVTMSEARTVTVNFTLEQYALTVTVVGEGGVVSDPAGINCPTDCDETYNYNTPVTLTANPAPGSTFTGWSGACSGTGSCVVTLSEAQNVIATFTQDTYQLYLPIIFNPSG